MGDLKVVQPQPATVLENLVEDYMAHCRARGLSIKTLNDNYGYVLRTIFLPWAARERIKEPGELTTRVLDRFTSELLEKGGKRGPLSRHTIATYTETVNWFLRWLTTEEELPARVSVPVPKPPKRILEVLSREEIQSMEDAARSERDKLIVRLLADTGMRVGELVGLRPQDLIERDRNHYVRVRGKGDKERLIPIPRLWRRLQRYAEKGRPRDTDSELIFLSLRRDRRTGSYEPLTNSGVEQVIRGLATSAEISRRVYPHMLRHSYATWALNRGMNPIMLAQILGHSSLVMIQRNYAHQTPSDAHEMMAKLLLQD